MGAPIVVDAVVKSAEGEIYRVRSLWNGIAECVPYDEGGDAIELPAEELRRVTDPRRRRPPIEGMPEKRPICGYCGCKLAPLVHEEYAGPRFASAIVRRVFVRWRGYGYQGEIPAFHSLSCASRFGRDAYAAGYRVKRGK